MSLDLDAIRVRARDAAWHIENLLCCKAHDSAADVPILITEVERLRAVLADEQAAHAKTCANFEESTEFKLEETDALRAELAEARREFAEFAISVGAGGPEDFGLEVDDEGNLR